MEYINKKTGAVIETNGTISGGDWCQVMNIIQLKT